MGREVEFGKISTVLEDITYPVAQTAAADAFSDVTLVLADGTADLGELISATAIETFESASDIETALHNVLPRRAVGEPYQSEGDA
jgi:SHS2 domain-containing protein